MADNRERKSLVLNGLAINHGTVYAPACLYSAERHRTILQSRLETADAVARDITRLDNALRACSAELDRITADAARAIGRSEAEIFTTQKHIMNDPEIQSRVRAAIQTDLQNVEYAVHRVMSDYEEQFRRLSNVYMRERASDIGEVRTRLLDQLRDTRPGFVCEGRHNCSRGRSRIIAAEQLTPDMIVQMDLQSVRGFITEHGGISSHAAVLARSLGVPAVSGLAGLMDHISCSDMVFLDGDTGTVHINPERAMVAHAESRAPEKETSTILVSPQGTTVMANASFVEDVQAARTVQADGIGLFRTEMLFLRENRLLSEDEQYGLYRQVLETMDGRPVIFRLIDVGGDKPMPFLRIEQEANPYLGWRGARFLLGSQDILALQVRALARASAHAHVKMMVPMVIDSAQTSKLLSMIGAILLETGVRRESIEVGAMFEVPSAIYDAAGILAQIDFGSIGSNDLIQYTFAIDRNNERVSHDYNPDHPVLWSMLSQLSQAARAANKPLSICGEMAAREGIPKRLVNTGITSLSVSPRLISRVRCELGACSGADSNYEV